MGSQETTPSPAWGSQIWVWSVATKGVCLHFAACGDPCCQLPGDLELTSLPGDRFQVAGASRQLAGVEPQAATTVRGLLASGTGCCGRSAADRREVAAAMPVAARTSPVPTALSLQ